MRIQLCFLLICPYAAALMVSPLASSNKPVLMAARAPSTANRIIMQLDDNVNESVEIKEESMSPLKERLKAMEARNAKNGAIVLGVLFAFILWVFTLPPDIRRSRSPLPDVVSQVAIHYETCGREVPCIRFDLSVDPKSQQQIKAIISAATGGD